MAKNPKATNLFASTSLDAGLALCDGGILRIYDGTQPATADSAISGPVLLAELTLGSPAFDAAVAGVAAANAITSDASANATGTAAWFRIFQTDGTTPVLDGSVGVTAGQFDLVLTSVDFISGDTIGVTSLTVTMGKG